MKDVFNKPLGLSPKKQKNMIQQTFILLACSLLILSCSSKKDLVIIPANSSYEIKDHPAENYHAVLDLKNAANIDVKVVSRENDQQIKGFGLGRFSEETILVEKENKLLLTNNSNKVARIRTHLKEKKYSAKPIPPEVPATPKTSKTEYIEFTLLNTSNKSIPLFIPSVMNPNLSPYSSSGVSLKIGQEIIFKYKGKKRVLLEVSDAIKNGDKIDAADLLKEAKKNIDEKK